MTTPDLAVAYTTYAPALRRALMNSVPADDVDDTLSDIFVSALTHAASYEDRGWPISAWLYTIMRSRAIDVQRRRKRWSLFPLSEQIATPGPETTTEQRLLQAWVRQLIVTHLTGTQRQVMWLRFVADLAMVDVAERLGLTLGAVKAHEHRALVVLRQVLGAQSTEATL